MSDRLSQGWEKAKASVPLEEGAEPAAPGTEGEPAVAAPAEGEAAPVTEAVTEGEAEPATAEAAPELEFDDGVSADPVALASELKNDPAAEKFFNDRPDLKGKVFGALRRDAENREIRQYIPDVDTAKLVTQAASTFQNIDNRFLQATTPEGARSFLESWVREAMIVGEDGKPKTDASGNPELHPALNYVFDHIVNNRLSVLGDKAKKDQNERLELAVNILRDVLSPSSQVPDDVPDELKPYAETLKAQKAVLDKRESDAARQQRELRETTHQQSVDRTLDKAESSILGQLKPQFAKSGLTKFEEEGVIAKIGKRLDAKLAEHPYYESVYNSILLEPPSAEREAKLLKHVLSYTNPILGKIATEAILEAKEGPLTRQADKQNKVDSQKKASATDPRGSAVTPSSPQPQNG
jgi:hypothetical protein